ncbi:hypothetical protein CEB3_c30390 [Peptococcaceae bacterium CEB3]|nr:hypothetical protein CEB3_c30390 [Peptococcaceae bacterium CEB3]
MPLLERLRSKDAGYQPLVLAGSWQVAVLNFAEEQAPENLRKVDSHTLTDEVFVLLSGKAVLIVAEDEGEGLRFYGKSMEPRLVYNVPVKTWHNIALAQDAEVLIVEDRDSHLGNYEFRELTAAEYAALQGELKKYF